MTEIWADFNARDEKGLVPSQLSRADGPVQVGERVVAYDFEGNRCAGYVIDVNPERDLVRLAIEWNQFEAAETPLDTAVTQ